MPFKVYYVTHIESRKERFLVVPVPIVLPTLWASFAYDLVRWGQRVFHWEESGVFSLRSEAKACKQKWLKEVCSQPTPDDYYLNRPPQLGRQNHADPWIRHSSTLASRQEMLHAARTLHQTMKKKYQKQHAKHPYISVVIRYPDHPGGRRNRRQMYADETPEQEKARLRQNQKRIYRRRELRLEERKKSVYADEEARLLREDLTKLDGELESLKQSESETMHKK